MTAKPQLTNAQINKYSIYSLATITAMMPAFLYYRTFMQVNLGIPAELLAVLVLVGTGADFVFSLIAGPVIAKSSGGKWGKYRIFFVFAPWIMFAGAAIVYAAPAGIDSALIKGIITIVGYLMICGAVSFMGNANFGLIATMAGPSLEVRNKITAKAAQMMALASILVSALILPIKAAVHNATGNEQLGYITVSVLLGSTILISSKMVLDVSKPYDLPRPPMTAEEKAAIPAGPSVGAMFASVLKNPQLLIMILVFTLYQFANLFVSGFEIYFFMFWKMTPETYVTALTVHQTVRSVVSWLFAFIGPVVGMKLGGKKNALGFGLALWGVSLTGVFFVCGGNTPWWVYTIFAVINFLGLYTFTGFGVNYFLDCGEYGYYKTGEDNRTIAMSMYNIPAKIATMLAGTLSSMALAWINFDSVSISGGELTSTIQNGFLACFALLPAICMFVAAAIVFVFYKISDKDAAFYAAENAKKNTPVENSVEE